MIPESSLPHSQMPAICPYSVQLTAHNHPMYLVYPEMLSTVGEFLKGYGRGSWFRMKSSLFSYVFIHSLFICI